MHELSIAENILELVQRYRGEHGFTRLLGITLRIGLLAAVDEDALRFAFEVLVEGGPDDGACVVVEKTYPTARCVCGNTYPVEDMLYLCPACGSPGAELSGGDEMNIVNLEVE